MENPNYPQILIKYIERKNYITTKQKYICQENLYQEIQKPRHEGGSKLLHKLMRRMRVHATSTNKTTATQTVVQLRRTAI